MYGTGEHGDLHVLGFDPTSAAEARHQAALDVRFVESDPERRPDGHLVAQPGRVGAVARELSVSSRRNSEFFLSSICHVDRAIEGIWREMIDLCFCSPLLYPAVEEVALV